DSERGIDRASNADRPVLGQGELKPSLRLQLFQTDGFVSRLRPFSIPDAHDLEKLEILHVEVFRVRRTENPFGDSSHALDRSFPLGQSIPSRENLVTQSAER